MAQKIVLRGIVQGVFCRAYCHKVAKLLGLHGSATNCPDGSVRVLIDSDDKKRVLEYVEALKQNRHNITFYGSIHSVEVSSYDGAIDGDYTW